MSDANDPSTCTSDGAPSPFAFPVVGIGASAGGLEALEGLVHQLGPERIAFVVMQHLAPSHVSVLGDILARATRLRVVTVRERASIEAGVVYVAPAGVDLVLEGDELVPMAVSAVRRPPRSIDNLMRSLAANAGPMAIGVVLSGAGDDGTLGLKAIKEAGGITFVQEPRTASQSSMPQSALDAGSIDFVLTPSQIGDELMRLAQHPFAGDAQPFQAVDRAAMGKTSGTCAGRSAWTLHSTSKVPSNAG